MAASPNESAVHSKRNSGFEEDIMFDGLFQPMHLLVIAGLALLIFGPKKLPELGKGLGDGIRGFKSAMNARPAVARVKEAEAGPAA
jgi:sec-independent protein translocase protein TatA